MDKPKNEVWAEELMDINSDLTMVLFRLGIDAKPFKQVAKRIDRLTEKIWKGEDNE